jgi:hypothetical protein
MAKSSVYYESMLLRIRQHTIKTWELSSYQAALKRAASAALFNALPVLLGKGCLVQA